MNTTNRLMAIARFAVSPAQGKPSHGWNQSGHVLHNNTPPETMIRASNSMQTYSLPALTVRATITVLALLVGVTSVGAYTPEPAKVQAQDSPREQASSHKSDHIPARTIHTTGFAATALLGVAASVAPTATAENTSPAAHSRLVQIRPLHVSGKCLNIQGGSTANSAHVIQYQCHGGDNQKFWLVLVDLYNLYFEIRPKSAPDKCLDISGGSTANSAHLIQYQCHGGDNQKFEIINQGFTEARIKPGPGFLHKCLDIQGGSTANSAHVIQYTCHSLLNNRRFEFPPTL